MFLIDKQPVQATISKDQDVGIKEKRNPRLMLLENELLPPQVVVTTAT